MTRAVSGEMTERRTRRWLRRRRQTARVAWGCFAAGWAALGLWTWQMTVLPAGQGRFWAAVQFLPF